MRLVHVAALLAAMVLPMRGAMAQSEANLAALRGLVPFAALGNSEAGKAALAANYRVTGAIQHGAAAQPLLLPFAAQQQQALQDAFITHGNLTQLADALGGKLAAAYQSVASYTSSDDGKTTRYTSLSDRLAQLIVYTTRLTASDSNAGKFFFANATTNGTLPVSPAAAAILASVGGATDVLGRAYGKPAGSPGADPYGDSRPFQTEPDVLRFTAPDYFGAASGNTAYLDGPAQNLTASPSFPSGHTTYGYTGALLLALLVPQRYGQEIARGAEYGNDRIVLGAHYAMDVIGGRTLALYDLAHLLANDPAYVGQGKPDAAITDYPAALAAARADMTTLLERLCGAALATCAAADTSRFADATADAAFYEATQTYGLPVVFPATAESSEDVAAVAPEAGWLLKAAFPALTLAQADAILTRTEGPGGGFLDNGSAFGVYSRLDLVKAGAAAAALAAP